MAERLTLALAQLNPHVGDLAGNLQRLREARAEAASAGADLVVAPEMAVCGYPPEDLVLKPFFQDRVEETVRTLAADTADDGPALLVGSPWRYDGALYNACLLLDGGAVSAERFKAILPNYGVFDEKRLFAPGDLPGPIPFRGLRLGAMTCEDMWSEDVAECLEENGADLFLVVNGSPFEAGKFDQRQQLALARVTEAGRPLAYVNLVGGQDELVFDGASFVVNADHQLAVQAPFFQPQLVVTHWEAGADGWHCQVGERHSPPERTEAVYRALMTGLRDYVDKNGFPGVLVGLSGGIDSALTAALAADALGPARVRCVLLPSPYTSQASRDDASAVAQLLGARLDVVPIEGAMQAMDSALAPLFAGYGRDVTEENLQARLRGNLLMALSNKFGHMLLATGNKSELSVGYATLYGDMCGGFALLKDVYKTTAYRLAEWRNAQRPADAQGPEGRVIPDSVIHKAPSAELAADQKDTDSLPPYDRLDDILIRLIDKEWGLDAIAERGHDRALVAEIWKMLDGAEYKRRQAPPGVKVTGRLFGRDRRYPITNAFRRQLVL